MRVAALLLISALMLAPLSLAQSDGAPRDKCDDTETEAQCKERYCKENPDRCKSADQKRADESTSKPDNRSEKEADDSKDPDNQEDREESSPEWARECSPDCSAELRYIGFDFDGLTISNYTLKGQLLIDELSILSDASTYKVGRTNGAILVAGEDWKLSLHDNPTGLISFSGDAKIALDFATDKISAKGEGYSIQFDRLLGFANGYIVEQNADKIIASEKVRFHISPSRDNDDDEDDERDYEKIRDAVEKHKVGAEIKVRSMKGVAEEAEVYNYDDMEIVVDTPAKIDADTPMRIVVSANFTDGRTIVVDVDSAVLSGPDLELRYFDIQEDGAETEIVFRMADSLEDVLNADDDGGQPEYWVVKDANGIQVMASMPSWSTHAITIASIGEFVTQPSVLVGIGAGVAGVAIAALTMMRPRRDEQ